MKLKFPLGSNLREFVLIRENTENRSLANKSTFTVFYPDLSTDQQEDYLLAHIALLNLMMSKCYY